MEREGGAIALLADFQIVEKPPDVGEEEVADLGFVLKRRARFWQRGFLNPSAYRQRKARPGSACDSQHSS